MMMFVKWSKLYEKWQVISQDGRVLEEFKKKSDAKRCAKELSL